MTRKETNSKNTIAQRFEKLAHNTKQQLLEKSKQFLNFSIAVGKSTDIKKTARLAILLVKFFIILK